ncbi:MAG: LppP/LprE family lipoprotein [Vicinamibacterales bacterium]
MTLASMILTAVAMTTAGSVILAHASSPSGGQSSSGPGTAQTAGTWMDTELRNWNEPPLSLPRVTSAEPLSEGGRCQLTPRDETPSERALAEAGWFPFLLFDRRLAEEGIEIVGGMTGVDGMCRPMEFNAFVFLDGRFAGTLAPDVMSSREDGSIGVVRILDRDTVSAEFARYAAADALCCPSRRMTVRYRITRGDATHIAPTDVRTTREF